MNLIPKNWEGFQHYRDRSPSWIKLHKSLLDDKVFQRLPVAARALAPMLWLIASESSDGVFCGDVDELAFRLRDTEKNISVSLDTLISAGFFLVLQPASNLLATGYQSACLEERREEKEKEERREEEKPEKIAPIGFIPPDWVNFNHWNAWHECQKRKKATDSQKQLSVDKLALWKSQGLDHAGALENAAIGGYQGLFLPDKSKAKASEPAWRTEQRNRTLEAVPAIADTGVSITEFFDVEARNVVAVTLGR